MTRSFGKILGAALCLMLAACGQSGTYYEKSPEDITSALQSATPPLALMGRTVTDSRVFEEDGNIITALISSDGPDLLHIVTAISPDGTGSYVSNSLLVPAAEGDVPYNVGLMQMLADEHVTAAIEGRAFNMLFATPVMGTTAISMIPGGDEHIQAANEAAAMFSEMERGRAQYERQEEFRAEYGDDWGADASP